MLESRPIIEEATAVSADDIFENFDRQVFRNARHKTMCHETKGRITKRKTCGCNVSTTDIVNLALQSWREYVVCHGSNANVNIPLSPKRLDIAVYRHSYNM